MLLNYELQKNQRAPSVLQKKPMKSLLKRSNLKLEMLRQPWYDRYSQFLSPAHEVACLQEFATEGGKLSTNEGL